MDSIRTFPVSFDGFYVDSDVSQSAVNPADTATSLISVDGAQALRLAECKTFC